jgi:hypothetical protein
MHLIVHFQGSYDSFVGIDKGPDELFIFDQLNIPHDRFATKFRIVKTFLNPLIGQKIVSLRVDEYYGVHKVVSGLGGICDGRQQLWLFLRTIEMFP